MFFFFLLMIISSIHGNIYKTQSLSSSSLGKVLNRNSSNKIEFEIMWTVHSVLQAMSDERQFDRSIHWPLGPCSLQCSLAPMLAGLRCFTNLTLTKRTPISYSHSLTARSKTQVCSRQTDPSIHQDSLRNNDHAFVVKWCHLNRYWQQYYHKIAVLSTNNQHLHPRFVTDSSQKKKTKKKTVTKREMISYIFDWNHVNEIDSLLTNENNDRIIELQISFSVLSQFVPVHRFSFCFHIEMDSILKAFPSARVISIDGVSSNVLHNPNQRSQKCWSPAI